MTAAPQTTLTTPASLQVVLITGASAGIGYETALAFARHGYKVAATARRQERLEGLVKAAEGETGLTGEIVPFVADVTKAQDMQNVVDSIMVRWGRLDVLIPNAGIGQRGALVDSPWDDLDVVLRTNIDGVLHTVRAAVPAMRQSGGGHIVTLSSVLSIAISPYATIYAVSKAALNAIVRGLRVELEPDSIWVTNILLGQTHSEFAKSRRGQEGRVAGKLPTMTAQFVAQRIFEEAHRNHRTVTLRLIDRLINFGGLYLPRLTDRLLGRVYKAK
ncbi:MAG: SDR family NAD(P)-dependent oxidoreductase [Chloroflexota bacterium]